MIFVGFLITIFFVYFKRPGWERFIAIPIVISLSGAYYLLDHIDRQQSVARILAGNLAMVRGCITEFRTNDGEPHSAKSSMPDETWSVQGTGFGYKDVSDLPSYHIIESQGGVIHTRQYLRVKYLISPIFRRKEIAKIEAGSETCNDVGPALPPL